MGMKWGKFRCRIGAIEFTRELVLMWRGGKGKGETRWEWEKGI